MNSATLDPNELPETAKTKKVFVKSYGCQMNVYDSERMADVLAPEGYSETTNMHDADLIILNTCHIREKAAEKVYSELGRVRDLKTARQKRGAETKVVVAGCVAQAEGAEILRRASIVDVVVGPQSYQHLPQLLKDSSKRPAILTDFPEQDKFSALPIPNADKTRARGVSAFVTVQEGCDKFCSFCVVPYTRGGEFSRPVEKVLVDIDRLIASGVREITLIGQNVNAYHGQGLDGAPWSLGKLLYHLETRIAQAEQAAHAGLVRVRYMTSHPCDMDEILMQAHRDLPYLMPYLHLPLQAGSDRILAAMNRKHTADDYRRIIDKMRNYCPDLALSSDFIVGFPDETEEDFAQTLKMAEDIKFASSYFFKYSQRPGTPAANKGTQVPEDVKTERFNRLQDLLNAQRRQFNEDTVGKTFNVLIEREGRNAGQMVGKSPYLQSVQLENAVDTLKLGDLVSVKITKNGSNSLYAECII
jgi:tRNA-2-methylthio-N6-dimethylallyladenosine synthase